MNKINNKNYNISINIPKFNKEDIKKLKRINTFFINFNNSIFNYNKYSKFIKIKKTKPNYYNLWINYITLKSHQIKFWNLRRKLKKLSKWRKKSYTPGNFRCNWNRNSFIYNDKWYPIWLTIKSKYLNKVKFLNFSKYKFTVFHSKIFESKTLPKFVKKKRRIHFFKKYKRKRWLHLKTSKKINKFLKLNVWRIRERKYTYTTYFKDKIPGDLEINYKIRYVLLGPFPVAYYWGPSVPFGRKIPTTLYYIYCNNR